MGIAAYNRGTALLSREIDAKMPDHSAEVFRSINSMPRGKTKLFQPTVVRSLNNRWYLMNRKEGGFASRAYEYKTLRQLFAHWNCYAVGCGTDKHSFYYEVEPIPES